MPTLPLYTPNPNVDASHRVLAPGGYEAWHFDAESDCGEVRLVATFGEGNPIAADYLRRYLRYRRSPTRHPPPLPSECPWFHFAVYEKNRPSGRVTTHGGSAAFAASAVRGEVGAGGNEFVRSQDGTLALNLRGCSAPAVPSDRHSASLVRVSAELSFRPTPPHAPCDFTVLARHAGGDEHRWIVADPVCEVSGTVTVSGAEGSGDGRNGRTIEFRGRGYHDHTYGTGPLLTAMRHGLRGRLISRDRVIAFYVAEPLHRHQPVEVLLVEADAAGVRKLVVGSAPTLRWHRTSGRVPYPAEVHVLGAGIDWKLSNPVVLESAGRFARLTYASSGVADGGMALCEAWAAPRLPWRLASRAVGPAAGRADGPSPQA